MPTLFYTPDTFFLYVINIYVDSGQNKGHVTGKKLVESELVGASWLGGAKGDHHKPPRSIFLARSDPSTTHILIYRAYE